MQVLAISDSGNTQCEYCSRKKSCTFSCEKPTIPLQYALLVHFLIICSEFHSALSGVNDVSRIWESLSSRTIPQYIFRDRQPVTTKTESTRGDELAANAASLSTLLERAIGATLPSQSGICAIRQGILQPQEPVCPKDSGQHRRVVPGSAEATRFSIDAVRILVSEIRCRVRKPSPPTARTERVRSRLLPREVLGVRIHRLVRPFTWSSSEVVWGVIGGGRFGIWWKSQCLIGHPKKLKSMAYFWGA